MYSCHLFLISSASVTATAKSLHLCLTLGNPIDVSPPGSPVPGILQARTLEWVAISFSSAWKWKSESEVTQSCLTLSDPMDQVHTISVLYRAIFAWNVLLVSQIFLKISLVFPILLFSSISLHWPLRKAFLSLLAILWNSAFRWVYLSISPLLFVSLLFTAICKASSGKHFAFLHFFSMGMILIPVSCTMSWTSVHSSSGTLSDLVP